MCWGYWDQSSSSAIINNASSHLINYNIMFNSLADIFKWHHERLSRIFSPCLSIHHFYFSINNISSSNIFIFLFPKYEKNQNLFSIIVISCFCAISSFKIFNNWHKSWCQFVETVLTLNPRWFHSRCREETTTILKISMSLTSKRQHRLWCTLK